MEGVLTSRYFTHYIQNPIVFKANKKDGRMPRSFEKPVKIRWADTIHREYRALLEPKTWIYATKTADTNQLPYIWDFQIKDTSGSNSDEPYHARCCLQGDNQVDY